MEVANHLDQNKGILPRRYFRQVGPSLKFILVILLCYPQMFAFFSNLFFSHPPFSLRDTILMLQLIHNCSIRIATIIDTIIHNTTILSLSLISRTVQWT